MVSERRPFPSPLVLLTPHVGNAYALYAMKRDGLARVSKIDADALLDKNKSLAEGAIVFPTFDVGGHHGRSSRILVSSK